MTTRTELLEFIRNGENSGVEFKRDDVRPRDLAKELVAFANLSGGRVLLGVEDSGALTGVTRHNLEEWVMTACRDNIRPEVVPYFELVRDVEPGADVAVVSVERGYALHCVQQRGEQHRTYYIRVGSLSREANQDELGRLLQQRGMLRSELQPVSGSGLADLDERRLEDYFVRVRAQGFPENGEERRRLLINTELLDEDGAATVAGMLLFGRDVRRFLPHSGFSAAAYPGADKDYATIERSHIQGPLVALQGKAGVLETGIVEEAVAFVRRNAGTTSRLVDGARREDIPAYPDDAIRETLVNAVVHRDYMLTATDVEMSIYDDRLEVVSPGRLPNGITPQRMRDGARAARNQLLKDVMRDHGYLEHMGMGVRLKIVAGMRRHNGTDPDLIEDGESLTVRLWRGQPRRPVAV